MNSNQNIFGKITEDTRIYRIFQRDWFFQLFEDKKNGLVRPSKWNDPFENVFLRAEVRSKSMPDKKGDFSFRNDLYGQCWTLGSASDAMWQIYSPCQDAIRVRTTVGKLIKSIRAVKGNLADATCFIGRVKYLSEKELSKFGKNVFSTAITGEACARSLIVKRKAYKHEKEVRLVYFEDTTTKHPDGVYTYDLDPLALIDQAMVDSRVSEIGYQFVKGEIMSRTRLEARQIRHSRLYRQPKNFVVKIP